MSNLFVDKISGKSGTSSGAPITLSGDTVTLGSGVDLSSVTGIPAAGITGALPAGVTGGDRGLVHILTDGIGTSNSTGSTFANFYNDLYTSYYIVMRDIRIGTDSIEWRMQFNLASNQTVEAGAQYWTGLNGWSSNSGAYNLGLENATYIRICPNLGNTTGEVFNGHFTMSGFKNTAVFTSIQGSIGWNHGGDYTIGTAFSGQYNGNENTLFSGFTLTTAPSSVNFAAGTISMYGHTTS